MRITNIDYDDHKGRIALGRVIQGTLNAKQQCKVGTPEGLRNAKVNELFVFENFGRKAVETVQAGDICALAGIGDVMIGETVVATEGAEALPVVVITYTTGHIQ